MSRRGLKATLYARLYHTLVGRGMGRECADRATAWYLKQTPAPNNIPAAADFIERNAARMLDETRMAAGAGNYQCPYPGCTFVGTDDAVDDHRATGVHSDQPQAGSNIRGRK